MTFVPSWRAALCVAFLWSGLTSLSASADEDTPLRALPEITSTNGVLTATLEAKEQSIKLGRLHFDGMTYNGDYAGPVLRAYPGDVLRIKLINHLSEPTNLHFHGLHASPLAKGDNMHIVVEPGQSFDYDVAIPPSQPPGLYWYHTHIHGRAQDQISSGLSGTLIVEGLEKQLPQIASLKQHIFVLKDHTFAEADNPDIKNLHKLAQTMNGQLFSTLTMRPHETQLWRFSNQSANLYFHIALKGHRFRIIATDGVVTNKEIVADVLDLGPSARIEALVDAGDAGTYDIVSEHTMTGTGDQLVLERTLGRVTVTGKATTSLATLSTFPDKKDLRASTINERRTFTLTQANDDKNFFMNGKHFDHTRVDTRVPLGNIEEWTVKNDTDDMHVFHIHQIHFQVAAINGKPQPFNGYVDAVRVPERGDVTLLMPFTEPQIVGTFMYHCHVLKHEDGGMMANIEVYDPKQDHDVTTPHHHAP